MYYKILLRRTALLLVIALPLLARAAADGDPATDNLARVIPYQGALELDGKAVTGPLDLRFTLYDDEGNPLWTEAWTAADTEPVVFHASRFSVLLGKYQGIAATIFDAENLFLGIEIDPDGDGAATWIALQGRQQITPVPYALWSAQGADFRVAGTLTVEDGAAIDGGDNDGNSAALKVTSGSQTMLIDGNEIDSNDSLFLNTNLENPVVTDGGVEIRKGGLSVSGGATVAGSATIDGAENDGAGAALKVTSGSQTMLIDGNEIDSIGTTLLLNNNSHQPVKVDDDLVVSGKTDFESWEMVINMHDPATTSVTCPAGKTILFGFFLPFSDDWSNDDVGQMRGAVKSCTPGATTCSGSTVDTAGNDEALIWAVCH